MIIAENLIKTYRNGKIKALNNISLQIEDGGFLAILGASGSGKSTLMNALSGLESVDSGKIYFNDIDLTSLNDRQLTEFRRKNVGFVFQQYYLLPQLSVENNIRMGANLVGGSDYLGIAEALGLSDKLKSKPHELSGGEQQRVCIARALAKKPAILFLDEPTGALDEKTGRDVLDCIVKEKDRLKFTMVMVTHNQNIAEMAQIIVKMNSGAIIEKSANGMQKSAYEIGW